MKKIYARVSLFLLFTLFLSFFQQPAYAGSISLNKTNVQPGENVTATFTVDWMEQEGGFIGFYEKTAGNSTWITYKNFSFEKTNLVDNSFTVKVDKAGSYEFRLFKDYYGTTLLAKASVECRLTPSSSVAATPSVAFTNDILKASYTISAIDGDNTGGWIGLYKVGAKDDDYITYKKTGGKSGVFEVNSSLETAKYEFRLFKDTDGTEKLATSNSIDFTYKEDPNFGKPAKANFVVVTGEVYISPDPNKVEWIPCTPKTVIKVGDHIATGEDSSCILIFEDNTTYAMKPETEVVVKKVQQNSLSRDKLDLVLGHLWANTKKMLTNGTMEVEMGQAVAGIKGTSFICEYVNGVSTLKVMEGSVEFTSNATKKSATIGANESMSATSSGLSAKSKFDFNKESSDWSILGVDRYAGYKKHIYLTVGKSTMLVEALEKEIDPGRGTSVIKQSGRTLLPIRSLIETMGGTVGWSQSDSKVTLTYNGTIVEMWVGNKTIKVNGISKTVDVAPMTINGRTMVPVRFASENLGATVDWVESTQTVIISYH